MALIAGRRHRQAHAPPWLLLAVLLHLAIALASQLEPFDVREATIDSIHNALFTGQTTCRAVVSAHLARIEAFNPTINAILAIHPAALAHADELDARLAAANTSRQPLFCIPLLLKDNFDLAAHPTTAGSRALAAHRPPTDAPTVAALRAAGAVVLGKANLHELALEGLGVSSLGGQTRSPYAPATRTPGGSSAGSGAALAVGMAVLATGTDTVNSLRSPAGANALVSVRPTRGLVSRAGVVPVSYTQDAVGALARSVGDLAVVLGVLAGVGGDAADNATTLVPAGVRGVEYAAAVGGGTLKGLRLGVVEGFFDRTASEETSPVNEAMEAMVKLLGDAGVTIVNVTEAIYNATALSAALDVQQFEYRELLTAYLSASSSSSSGPKSFEDIYSGTDFLVIPSQYQYIATAAVSSTGNASYAAALRGIANLTSALHATFARDRLDALLYPEQKNLVVKLGSPSQSGRNGILAALTGSPVVTVPAGFSPPSEDAPVGVPIGMELLGLPWSEGKLLSIAQHISVLAPMRRMPAFANGSVEVKEYASVPVVTPDTGSVLPVYPIGKLKS